MKKFLFLILLVVLPISAFGADPSEDRPYWSFEAKGGTFAPALPEWRQYYGKRSMPEYAVSLAYKFLRQVEIGVEGGASTAKGSGYELIHSQNAGQPVYGGNVTYTIYPVSVFVLFRGIVNENQWIVPYVGGGFTRMYYEDKIEGQGTTHGRTDGYNYRGGLQLLLDGMDRDAANNLYLDYGVYHTYFFVEAEKTHAVEKSSSADLGGTAYLMGLLFEF